MTDIAIINRTSRIRDARFAFVLPALQAQITQDFAPAWGIEPVTLHLVGKRQQPDPAHWKLWLLNNSDEPGDLGYHENDPGLPEGKVFVEDDLRYGAEISGTLSHEILEMLADPQITRMGPTIDGAQYVVEVCDPVEADGDGYLKSGVRVSNFVLPSYYAAAPTPGPYDFRGLLPLPCPALRPGGFALFLKNNTWHTTAARYEDGSLSHRAIRPLGRCWRRAHCTMPHFTAQ